MSATSNDVLDQLKAGHQAIADRETQSVFVNIILGIWVFIAMLGSFLHDLGMNGILSYLLGSMLGIAYVVGLIRTYRRERDKRNAEFERAYQAASSTPGAHS